MAFERLKCKVCGKYFKFNWTDEKFYPQCECKEAS